MKQRKLLAALLGVALTVGLAAACGEGATSIKSSPSSNSSVTSETSSDKTSAPNLDGDTSGGMSDGESVGSAASSTASAEPVTPPTSDAPSPPETTVSLSHATVTLDRYDIYTLTASGSGALTWSSSDTSIVTVENGLLTAQGEGTATISVTDGTSTATCAVTVEDTLQIPILSANATEKTMRLNETFTVVPSLKYKNQTMTDAAYTYISSDPSIAEVDKNGTVTSKKIGDVTITVKADWRSAQELKTTIAVQVRENVTVSLSSSDDLEIYPVSGTIGGTTYKNTCALTYSVTVDEQTLSNAQVSFKVKSGEDKVDVSAAGVVTAKAVGEAEIYCEYTSSSGLVYASQTLTVRVAQVELDLRGTVSVDVDKSLTDVTLDLPQLFGGGTVLSVYEGKDLDQDVDLWENGKFKKELLQDFVGEGTMTVNTTTLSAKISVVWCDKIAYTAQDLHDLYLYMTNTQAATQEGYTYSYAEGYFILANDIDMEGLAWQANVLRYNGGATGAEGTGFYGTLDGRGHFIKNPVYTENESGVIGSTLGMGGIIKNLGITGVNVDRTAGAFCSTNVGTIENVFVSGQVTAGYSYGTPALICQSINAGGVVKNAVAVVENDITTIKGATVLGSLIGSASEQKDVSNVYTIGACKTSIFSQGGSGATGNDTDTYFGFSTDDNISFATAETFGQFFTALPDGFNGYWKVKGDGLYFGGVLVASYKAATVVGLSGEDIINLYDTANADYTLDLSDYASATLGAVSIGGASVAATFENGILTVAKTEMTLAKMAHGVKTLRINLTKDGEPYLLTKTVTVSDYVISTVAEFKAFSTWRVEMTKYDYGTSQTSGKLNNTYGTYVVLTQSLDIGKGGIKNYYDATGNKWLGEKVGVDSNGNTVDKSYLWFCGTFDGRGNTLRYIGTKGLFGYTYKATIKDLVIIGVSMGYKTTKTNQAGVLTYVSYETNIQNVYMTLNMSLNSATANAGGNTGGLMRFGSNNTLSNIVIKYTNFSATLTAYEAGLFGNTSASTGNVVSNVVLFSEFVSDKSFTNYNGAFTNCYVAANETELDEIFSRLIENFDEPWATLDDGLYYGDAQLIAYYVTSSATLSGTDTVSLEAKNGYTLAIDGETDDETYTITIGDKVLNGTFANGVLTIEKSEFAQFDKGNLTMTIVFTGKSPKKITTYTKKLTLCDFVLTTNVDGTVELYLEEKEGQSKTFALETYVDGEKVATEKVSVTVADDTIATYTDGTFTALKEGETSVTISYTSESGATVTKTYTVTVHGIPEPETPTPEESGNESGDGQE